VRLDPFGLGDEQRARLARRPAKALDLGPQELDVGANDRIVICGQRVL